MPLSDLEHAITTHAGHFHCTAISGSAGRRMVDFRHLVTPPVDPGALPAVGRLAEFFATFGSVLFYADPRSGDAALHIAEPSAWAGLKDDCNDWFEDIDAAERADILPDWIDDCLVIGSVPRSGNYVLMPIHGDRAGHVIAFDHDGFEFEELGLDLVDFAERMLDLDAQRLTAIAAHMRFIENDDWSIQWWIDQLTDNRGNVVSTTD